MSKRTKRSLCFCAVLFAMFLLWTAVVHFVDVQPIGPENSRVGLATLNSFMLRRSSGAPIFERISKWAGYFALAVVFGLAVYGLIQWVRRKDIRKVDPDLLIAGGVYALTGGLYLLFELVSVNYRPVLEDGKLAASYPSSHTVLVIVVLLTFVMILEKRIAKKWVFHVLSFFLDACVVITVLFREQAGIHWFTDIIGGMILGGALVMLFQFATELAGDLNKGNDLGAGEDGEPEESISPDYDTASNKTIDEPGFEKLDTAEEKTAGESCIEVCEPGARDTAREYDDRADGQETSGEERFPQEPAEPEKLIEQEITAAPTGRGGQEEADSETNPGNRME